jgi:hypothetical protein
MTDTTTTFPAHITSEKMNTRQYFETTIEVVNGWTAFRCVVPMITGNSPILSLSPILADDSRILQEATQNFRGDSPGRHREGAADR